jgi:hypothetical protein
MSPRYTFKKTLHSSVIYPVITGKLRLCGLLVGVTSAGFNDLPVSKFVAARSFTFMLTAFGNHILRVINRIAGEQVVPINTVSIVASMASKFAFLHFSIVKFIRILMSHNDVVLGDSEATVPTFVFSRKPKPTRRGFVNLFPKAFFNAPMFNSGSARTATSNASASKVCRPFDAKTSIAMLANKRNSTGQCGIMGLHLNVLSGVTPLAALTAQGLSIAKNPLNYNTLCPIRIDKINNPYVRSI